MFKKPIAWLKKILGGAIEWLRPQASTAVKIVNLIKEAVESDTAGVVVAFTPFKWDDYLLLMARKYLPEIVTRLQVTGMILESGDPDLVIASLIKYLQQQNKDVKSMFYVQLAAEVTKAMADGQIDKGEAIAISQMIYKEIKEGQSNGRL